MARVKIGFLGSTAPSSPHLDSFRPCVPQDVEFTFVQERTRTFPWDVQGKTEGLIRQANELIERHGGMVGDQRRTRRSSQCLARREPLLGLSFKCRCGTALLHRPSGNLSEPGQRCEDHHRRCEVWIAGWRSSSFDLQTLARRRAKLTASRLDDARHPRRGVQGRRIFIGKAIHVLLDTSQHRTSP